MDLTSPDLHPLVLRRILDDRIPEWVLAPTDRLWTLVGTIGVVSMPTKNKLQALRSAILAKSVLEDWRVFEDVLLALMGASPNFQDVAPPSYVELIGGAHILNDILPMQFAPEEILQYCAAVAMFRGVPELIAPLTRANEYVLARGPRIDEVGRAAVFRTFLDTLRKEQEIRLEVAA